jgi:hypothetical protein
MTSLDRLQYIRPDEVPNIDLYMDQVTTFMEERLKSTARNPEDDKILTKTMINNYAKNKLIPSPDRKKYSKEHMLLLIFIYYFKGIMSISDIQTLLGPLTEKYFTAHKGSKGDKGGICLEDIYNQVVSFEHDEVENMKRDIIKKFHLSEKPFEGAPEEDKEFLRQFSFICTLSFDVYVKKLLIEKMIDDLNKPVNTEQNKSEKEKVKPK